MMRLFRFVTMLFDGRVPLRLKLAFFAVAGGYLLFPVDLVPDLLPVVGIADDGGVILTAMVIFTRYARKYTEEAQPPADSKDSPARKKPRKAHDYD